MRLAFAAIAAPPAVDCGGSGGKTFQRVEFAAQYSQTSLPNLFEAFSRTCATINYLPLLSGSHLNSCRCHRRDGLAAIYINRATYNFRAIDIFQFPNVRLAAFYAVRLDAFRIGSHSIMTATQNPPDMKPGCSNCVMRGLGLCSVLTDAGWEQPYTGVRSAIRQDKKTFFARRTIFHPKDPPNGIPIICEGWAASTMKLSNGRRQILSILLPGEMVTSRLLCEPQIDYSVDAITSGSYRTFDLPPLRAALSATPGIFDRFLSAYNYDRNRADQLIADLGRRTATGRIARLLLDIWTRLEKSGKVENGAIEFPLRQTHIADSTGLTTVYVSKVINGFRKDRLVEFTDRSLKILDIDVLRELAA